MRTIEQLRELRRGLPRGKKDPWGGCCPSKRVLLNRLLKKDSLDLATDGEITVMNEFLQHCVAIKKENKEYAKVIAKLANS